MTPNLGSMLAHCTTEGPPRAHACVAAVAASLPEASRLRRLHERFRTLPVRTQARIARDPERAARAVARALKCPPAEPGRGAWGIVQGQAGRAVFAAFTGGAWYARCAGGLARVHPSRVLASWEVV